MADKKEGASLFSMNLGGKSKRITKFPDKTTINLVRFETEKSHTMDFLVVLLLLLCLVAFAKFFVYDQFTALQNAQRQYSTVQDQLFSLRQNNSVYSDVKAEYDRVTEWYMTEAEKNIIDNSGEKGAVTSAVIIDFIGGPGPNEQEASSGAETASDASGASGQNGGEA